MTAILYHSSSGIGNVIQTSSVVERLSKHYDVDVWHHPDCFPDAYKALSGPVREFFVGATRPTGNYSYQVFSSYTQKCYWFYPRLDGVEEINAVLEEPNEVACNLSVLPPLGISMECDPWIWHGYCAHTERSEQFDVCLHAGGKRNPEWESKRWLHFTALAKALVDSGLSVASIGSREEYIPGTEDRCGLPLLDSFGVLKGCRLHIANDCGSYHAACAMDVPNIVIFCSTAQWKNRHPLFHKKSRVIVKGLPCQPCQLTPAWGKCQIGQQCRDVPVKTVMEIALEELECHS